MNEEILDKMLRHFLGVERVKNGLVKKYLKILANFNEQILGMFSATYGKGPKKRATFEKMVRELKAKAHEKFRKQVTKDMREMVKRESSWLAAMLSGFVGERLVNEATGEVLDDILETRVRGFSIPKFIADLELKEMDLFLSTASVVAFDGLSLQEATSQLEVTQRRSAKGAASTIRTLVAHIKSEADRAVFNANKHLIEGEMLSVVFDTRTSEICIQHAEEQIVYDVGQAPRPPFHYNCRTMIIPVLKSLQALKKGDRRLVPVDARVTMTGTVPQSFTFSYWLKRQPRHIQVELLGARRAAEFRRGKYSLNDLINQATGRFYPMDEFYDKVAA